MKRSKNMITELTKILKINFIIGFVWILSDLFLYYYNHNQFSIDELKIASSPVSTMLIGSILYICLKYRNE